ncbi:hypothetical protein EW146_g10316 [Bondarzewia mesenterica]|uniref:Uncharacterized protein n=1 Tax=Bondarzewia mesenterica TaxID=1095465 RepID=A0A4S4KYC6_9AGAM|nr:hypothetical protein EW146_g10316 [Bondarzewia mesenterica]
MVDHNFASSSSAAASNFQVTFGSMTDSQLRQTITQLSNAANAGQYQAPYVAPTPQRSSKDAHQSVIVPSFLTPVPSLTHPSQPRIKRTSKIGPPRAPLHRERVRAGANPQKAASSTLYPSPLPKL